MSREKHHNPAEAQAARETPAQEPAEVAEPASQETIRQLQQELAQANDRYLRTLAEFDNTRKRLHREQEDFAKFATETLVRTLLPTLDSLDQALIVARKTADMNAVVKGIELIHRQIEDLVKKEGVERIATVGQRFDPHRHEAVAQTEPQDGSPDNTVVDEVQVGYTMHGKVIRPAMVKVTHSKAEDEPKAG